jgi:DNA-binding IclR family transcriptional regulator
MPGTTDRADADTSLARALRILPALAGGRYMTVNEIASELGMPVSTLYRFLRELRRFGLVIEPVDGEYTLGPGLLDLALGSWLHTYLESWLEPALERLVTRHGETALAVVREGLSARTVCQAEAPRSVRLSFRLGELRPLHAGASATALLAFQPPAVIEAVIARGLEPFTDDTPTDGPALRGMLARIRRDGVAISRGEVDPAVLATAAPIFYRDHVLSAISIAGPVSRCTSRLDELAAGVADEARGVSEALTEWRPET